MPRPDQMNINVATWGRLLKKNINLSKSVGGEQQNSLTSEPMSGRRIGQSVGRISRQSLDWIIG